MFTRIASYYLTITGTCRRRLTDVTHDLQRDDGAFTAEYLMWIGIAVALAIAIGIIVTKLLTAKANSIKLN